MSYYVYILWSESIQRYYVGHTRDIEQRLMRHNRGDNSYTKKGMPWELKWCTEKGSKPEAY